MSKRYSWPVCTEAECGHRHTWPSQEAAQKATVRHWSTWVRADGTATCFCHGLEAGATFPCDETQKATEHA